MYFFPSAFNRGVGGRGCIITFGWVELIVLELVSGEQNHVIIWVNTKVNVKHAEAKFFNLF
jgi:hypothetical protein